MTLGPKLAVRALAAVSLCTLALPLSASATTRGVAATPCWKLLLNEWYSGKITTIYPIPCYQQAIKHLPTDVQVYSSARDDIERALRLAIAHKKNPKAPPPTITASPTPIPTTTSQTTTTSSGTKKRTTTTTPSSLPGNKPPAGAIPIALKNSSPGGATSFPLPLIILGGLALFLLAAGAVGLIIRRMQGRGTGTPGPPETP